MGAIAAISLLVAGIGIRRSIGARRFDIVRQFLTEPAPSWWAAGCWGSRSGFFWRG
jgi:hypothetical protein